MAFLPSHSLKLTGGCFCSAIRYKISIPPFCDRPRVPGSLPTPIHPHTAAKPHPTSEALTTSSTLVPTHLPILEIDHCTSCRRASGSVIQVWLICEAKWITFDLLPQTPALGHVGPAPPDKVQSAIKYPAREIVNPSPQLTGESYVGHYSSNGTSHRTFCTRCGTPMTFNFSGDRGEDWKLDTLVDVAMGTLDRESLETEGLRPDRHGWWSDGIPWIRGMMYMGTGPLVRHPKGSPGMVVDEDKALIGEAKTQ